MKNGQTIKPLLNILMLSLRTTLIAMIVLLGSCRSNPLTKPLQKPQPISIDTAVSSTMQSRQPDLMANGNFPNYPISQVTLKNGIQLFHLQFQSDMETIALLFKGGEGVDRIKRDLLLQWNLIQIPNQNNNKIVEARLSSLSRNLGSPINTLFNEHYFGWMMQPSKQHFVQSIELLLWLSRHFNFNQKYLQFSKQKLALKKQLQQFNGHHSGWLLFKKLTLDDNLQQPILDPDNYRKLRQQMTLKRLQLFARNKLLWSHAILFVESSQNTEQIRKRINRIFDNLFPESENLASQKINKENNYHLKSSLSVPENVFYAISRPESTQVDLRLGFLAEKFSPSQKVAARIFIEILAGDPLASRMPRDLRERQGLSYYVSGIMNPLTPLDSIQFISSTEPHKLPALIEGMRAHIRKLINSGISQQAFEQAKQRLQVKNHMHILTTDQRLQRFLELLNAPEPVTNLSQQNLELQQLQYQDFLSFLQQHTNSQPFIILTGAKSMIQTAICKYYTNCKIIWYNNKLKKI